MSKKITLKFDIKNQKIIDLKAKGNKKSIKYLIKVIKRIQSDFYVVSDEATLILVNTILKAGECQDPMEFFHIYINTFKLIEDEIVFWDLKMLKNLIEDFLYKDLL